MKIAFSFDHNHKITFIREGLTIFIKNLASAMMEYDRTLELELWFLSVNKDTVKDLFTEVINKYPSRIKSFNEYSDFSLKLLIIPFFYIINPLNILRIIKHSFLFIFFRQEGSKKRVKSLLTPATFASSIRHEVLRKTVKKYSKADLVFPAYPMLPLALSFSCRKIMQIHDLFYLANRDIFIQQNPNLDNINKELTGILNNYANHNTIFASSTSYIRDNHVLKYIPTIRIEQTRVIPFPPMIKNTDLYTPPNREAFIEKYKLPEKYIAFPSQIRPSKNTITILQALLILKQKSITINFATTGSLHSLLPVFEFAKKHDLKKQIIETGDLPEEDLIALYKYSTLVVCPNIIEGFGMSGQCLEALTAGNIPVIHAKSLGIKESLENVGLTFETADLNWFDFDDYSALAFKIEDVLNNPKPHIEKQKHILSHYTKITWEDTAKKYLELVNIK